ncbi:MAG: hypothetical protein WDN09_01330 [bacterium]
MKITELVIGDDKRIFLLPRHGNFTDLCLKIVALGGKITTPGLRLPEERGGLISQNIKITLPLIGKGCVTFSPGEFNGMLPQEVSHGRKKKMVLCIEVREKNYFVPISFHEPLAYLSELTTGFQAILYLPEDIHERITLNDEILHLEVRLDDIKTEKHGYVRAKKFEEAVELRETEKTLKADIVEKILLLNPDIDSLIDAYKETMSEKFLAGEWAVTE